jgi:hypothetical protein
MLRGVAAVAAALLAAVAVSFFVVGGHTRRGCIAATVPYSIGGQAINACGQPARTICHEVGTALGFSGAAGRAVASQCRRAGLAVGPRAQ